MRKRTILAVVLTTLLLTACAGSKEKVTAPKAVNESVEVSAELETAETENGTEKVAKSGNGTEEVAESGNDTETESEESKGVEPENTKNSDAGDIASYEKGTVTEDVWESKWLSLRYQAPDNATMLREEELDEIMALGEEVLFEDFDRLQLEYAKIPTVYEMMCMGEDGITTLMITVEQLPASAEAETYFTTFAEQIQETSSMTYKVISKDGVTVIGDKEFNVLKCLVSYNGIEICQDYYVMIVGDRVVHLVITYKEETEIEEILKGFSVYE